MSVTRQRRVPGGRDVRIVIKTTAEIEAELRQRAAAAGLSLQAYLVACGRADADRPLSRTMWPDLERANRRLLAAGRNLNQLAKLANATGVLDAGLAGALGYLRTTLEQLRALLDRLDRS